MVRDDEQRIAYDIVQQWLPRPKLIQPTLDQIEYNEADGKFL